MKEIYFRVNGKPENYSRERKGRWGFYNPKSSKMKEFRNDVLEFLSKDDKEYLKNSLNEESLENKYIYLDVEFFLPIQKSSSKKDKDKKEKRKILPNKFPDIDNLTKFIMDALHDVFYLDDKIIVGISAKKFYSENPRTECIVSIFDKEELEDE